MNGSSQDGGCATFLPSSGQSECLDPTSSVLFDGNIPTLTGLDGDMWASQLLTLQSHNGASQGIVSAFTNTPNYEGVERVELVMFNCPEWEIEVQNILLLAGTSAQASRSVVGIFSPNITSCDSLVRVCTHVKDLQTNREPLTIITEPVIRLLFHPASGSNRTYLAEVGFYGDGSACPPDTIISTPPPDTTAPTPPDTTTHPPPDITTLSPSDTAIPDTTQEIAVECMVYPSCSTSTVLASVITVIATALLTTVISVLVMITVFKCHPKITPGGTETATTAGGEGQEYEEVDGGKGGVTVSDPTYMEVGERRGGNTFQLRDNEAYASTMHK